MQEVQAKFSKKNKKESFEKLKAKIKVVTEQRQKNAKKCLAIFNKYDKLLSIRVKDTVFKFWEQVKKQDISGLVDLNEPKDQ